MCDGRYWSTGSIWKTTAKAMVTVHTTVNSQNSNLGGVENLNGFNQETRPTNMNVIYIIRVW